MLTSLTNLITGTGSIATLIANVLMTIAFIAFMATVINFILKRRKGEAGALAQAGNMLFGATFALFVMVAVWGIVTFLSINLGVGIGGCVSRPSTLPGVSNNVDCGRTTTQSTGNSGNTNTRVYVEGPRPATQVTPITFPPMGDDSAGWQGQTNVRTQIVNPNAANNGMQCASGSGNYAGNGDLLYCNQARIGEVCTQGTCSTGTCINSSTNEVVNRGGYGTCQ